MMFRRVLLASMFVAVTLVLAIFASIPSTDDFDPSNPLWNGMSNFVTTFRVCTVELTHIATLDPSYLLLIVGPDKPFTDDEVSKIRRFLESGGTVVVFDDFGTGIQLLKRLGLNVEVYRGVLSDPLKYYRGYRFPRVEILNKSVVFDYGTALARADGACIGYSSAFSYVDLDLDNEPDNNEPRGPLCIAIEKNIGKGRIIFVTDADPAINALIWTNMDFLRKLFENRSIALVVDHWHHTLYTTARNALLKVAQLIFGTSLRYPFAVSMSVLLIVATSRFSILREGRSTYSDREVDRLIRRILARHPDWKREDVEKVVREVLCLRRTRSRS